jgi:hypothetical protein
VPDPNPGNRTMSSWKVRNCFYDISVPVGLVLEATAKQSLSGEGDNGSSQKVSWTSRAWSEGKPTEFWNLFIYFTGQILQFLMLQTLFTYSNASETL